MSIFKDFDISMDTIKRIKLIVASKLMAILLVLGTSSINTCFFITHGPIFPLPTFISVGDRNW